MTNESVVRDARGWAPVIFMDLSRPDAAIDVDIRNRWPRFRDGLHWELEMDGRSGWVYMSDSHLIAQLKDNGPKYARGPWVLCGSSDAGSKGYIRPNGAGPAICRVTGTGLAPETVRANTRLIEAAPDLAEVASALLEQYEVFLTKYSARQAGAFVPQAGTIEKLRAAVKKVGG